jgi:hypothetical protein
MAASLEASLVILDRASEPIRGIRRETRGLQGDAERAGKALDDMAGPKAARDLQKVAEDTRTLRGNLRGLRDEMPLLSRAFDVYDRRLVAAARDTDRLTASTDRLAGSLRTLGVIDAHPRVEIDGIAAARAELAGLRRDLSSFGRQRATASARISSGGIGGGGPRSGAYAGTDGFGVFTGRTGVIAGAAVAGLPLVQAVGGAAGALGGSLMGAGLGAGGIGLAGGGALTVGIAALASVAGPAKKNLDAAQQSYTAAVVDFGRQSREAIRAKRELDQAMAAAPAGATGYLAQRRALGRDWQQATRPAQADLLGLGAGAMRRVRRRALPSLAADTGVVAGATRQQGLALTDFMTNPRSLATLGTLSHAFADNLDEAEGTAEHLIGTLGNIARASLPFFHEGMVWIDKTTGGWEQSTHDIGVLRHEMSGYVDDLKAWGHLTESAFGLAHDVLMGGRPAGRSTVEDLTGTLDRWDHWVEKNPGKIDAFFRNAVTDTEKIAGSIADIVVGLDHMATELRPLLNPLTTVASLFGNLSGALGPGAAGSLLLGVRGLRQRALRGGGSPSGVAGSAGPIIVGGLGAAEGRSALGGLLNPRAAALGGLRTAGRFALPGMAFGGLLGASTDGDLGERLQGAASGATFGLLPSPVTRAMARQQGAGTAMSDVAALGTATTPAQVRAQIAVLERKRNAATAAAHGQGVSFLGIGLHGALVGGPQDKEMLRSAAAAKQYAASIRELRAQEQGLTHDQDVLANAMSRQHAADLTESFGKAFDTLSGKYGAEAAMDKTVHGVLDKMRGMRRDGARILGENTLAWAQEQAHANPALAGEVSWLTDHIERSFSEMGDRVVIVNGKILTGSAKQWQAIASAMTTPAERARQDVSSSFTAIQQQAVGALTAMGYSASEARSLVRGVESGAYSASQVGAKTGSGQPLLQSQSNLAKSHGYKGIGDGLGDGPGTAVKPGQHGAGSSALMGANAGLGIYANEASRFGLHVSSGLRPGAVTASGNRSLHASGNAIDETGPASGMLSYARLMASRFGGGLDELIHTPLGFGIKNGRRVPLSFWGSAINAQHRDHVHVGDRTPTGGGGGLASMSMDTAGPGLFNVSLRAPGSRLRGVPGALAGAAGDIYASGLSGKLAALSAGTAGGGGGGRLGRAQVEHLWIAAGGAPALAHQMANIAWSESGWQTGARNASGASGLWQILGDPFPGNPFDPLTNARMAVAKEHAGGLHPWDASRASWSRSGAPAGDGIGWSRPALGGGPMNITVAGSRGPTINVSSAPIHVQAGGVSEARVRQLHEHYIGVFVDHVLDELEHSETAMSVL